MKAYKNQIVIGFEGFKKFKKYFFVDVQNTKFKKYYYIFRA